PCRLVYKQLLEFGEVLESHYTECLVSQFLNYGLGVRCNHQFLVCGNHHHLHFRGRRRDNQIFTLHAVVHILVNLNAHILHPGTDHLPCIEVVLSHSGSEDEQVESVHCCNICANELLDLVSIHIERQECFRVTLVCCRLKVAHVG